MRSRGARSVWAVVGMCMLLASGMSVIMEAVSPARAAFAAPAPPAPIPGLARYPLPSPSVEPYDLTVGPDGNLWTPYNFDTKIARMTPTGSATEFPVSNFLIFPAITGGADGNLWYQPSDPAVYRLAPNGTEPGGFDIPNGGGGPNGLTRGPDGNVWFTMFQDGFLGYVTPAGAVTEFTPPTSTSLLHITGGPDGNVWFTDAIGGIVGRVTHQGAITEFHVPPKLEKNSGPDPIITGPDGNLWYGDPIGGLISRVTPAGVITQFFLPIGIKPFSIASGPDGAIWFADSDNAVVGRLATDGQVGLATPTSAQGGAVTPNRITRGPDGRLWFAFTGPSSLGAFSPFVPSASAPDLRRVDPPDGTTLGGTTITLTGYNIGTATKVLFGGTPATSFTRLGPGQLKVVVPPHAAGKVDVTVVTPQGTTATSDNTKFFFSSAACGKVVTANTTLTADIGPCYRDGVIVKADGVTLDLGGHRVFGFPEPSDGSAVGVRLPMRMGVTVKNGTVSGFDAGVVIRGGGSNTITQLTLTDNIGPDSPLSAEFGDGIFVDASARNRITTNLIQRNGIFDGIGIYNPGADFNVVENNIVQNNIGPADTGPSGQGIIINGTTGAFPTTFVVGTRIAGNTVRNNASAGISDVNEKNATIIGNNVTGNGTTNAIGNGIGLSVGSSWDQGPTQVTIQSNAVHGNGVDGIRLGQPRGPATGSPMGNTVVDNDAANNNANPGPDFRYERRKGYDLDDLTPDCSTNVWLHNRWGSGGYDRTCTTTGGSGPAVAPAQAGAADTAAQASFPNADVYQQLLTNGRRSKA